MAKHSETHSQETGRGAEGPSRWLASLYMRFPWLLGRIAIARSGLPHGSVLSRRQFLKFGIMLLFAASLLPARYDVSGKVTSIAVDNGEVIIADNNRCSLAEALANANDLTTGMVHNDCAPGTPNGNDEILLPSAGLFRLTATDNVLYGPTGLPAISSEVMIRGNGATIERQGDEPFRLLAVTQSGSLGLDQVTLKNGNAYDDYGGALIAYGDLNIEDSTLTGNSAQSGGGVFAYGGNLSISGTSFLGNEANTGAAMTAQYANVTVTETIISGNTSTVGSAGIYFLESDSSINESRFEDNRGETGAAMMLTGGSFIIRDCLIDGNVADTLGGGSYLRDSIGTISDSIFSSNSGNVGAGIAVVKGNVTIETTTLSGNLASGEGGALYNYEGNLLISRSTLSQNEAQLAGGGILNRQGEITVANSTISGNMASEGGGGTNEGALKLLNATVIANAATGGDGGGILSRGSRGNLQIARSITSGNEATGQGREIFSSGVSTMANDHNVFGFSDLSGVSGFTPGNSDVVPSVPLLNFIEVALKDNGGPTMTHALIPGSLAIDRGPSEDCQVDPILGLDQRGELRNRDGDNLTSSNECDAGAYEAPGKAPQTWKALIPAIYSP